MQPWSICLFLGSVNTPDAAMVNIYGYRYIFKCTVIVFQGTTCVCVCVDGLSVDSAHDAVDGTPPPYHFSVYTL